MRATRTAKEPVRACQAIVVMISGQGWPIPDIVALLRVSADDIRCDIHTFNDQGFDALDP